MSSSELVAASGFPCLSSSIDSEESGEVEPTTEVDTLGGVGEGAISIAVAGSWPVQSSGLNAPSSRSSSVDSVLS